MEQATRPSASSLVEQKINDCSGNCTTFASTDSFDNGTYYRDGDVDFDSSTTFNTSDGNIEIVVDGDVDFGGDGGPTNEDHGIAGDGNVTIYTNGTLTLNGNTGVNTDGHPADLLTYVHSSVDDVELKGTDQYRGLIYAPNSDVTISGGGKCKNGNTPCDGNIVGSVVTDTANVGSGKVRQVPDVGVSIEFATDTAITYLHISKNEIEINDG